MCVCVCVRQVYQEIYLMGAASIGVMDRMAGLFMCVLLCLLRSWCRLWHTAHA